MQEEGEGENFAYSEYQVGLVHAATQNICYFPTKIIEPFAEHATHEDTQSLDKGEMRGQRMDKYE